VYLILCDPTIRLVNPIALQQEGKPIICPSPPYDPMSDKPFGRNTAQENITYSYLLRLNWFDGQYVAGFQQRHHAAALRREAQGETSM